MVTMTTKASVWRMLREKKRNGRSSLNWLITEAEWGGARHDGTIFEDHFSLWSLHKGMNRVIIWNSCFDALVQHIQKHANSTHCSLVYHIIRTSSLSVKGARQLRRVTCAIVSAFLLLTVNGLVYDFHGVGESEKSMSFSRMDSNMYSVHISDEDIIPWIVLAWRDHAI